MSERPLKTGFVASQKLPNLLVFFFFTSKPGIFNLRIMDVLFLAESQA